MALRKRCPSCRFRIAYSLTVRNGFGASIVGASGPLAHRTFHSPVSSSGFQTETLPSKWSIGRTNSKLGLGFALLVGRGIAAEFVLDRTQVENLAGFLTFQAGRLRNSGRTSGVLRFDGLLRHADQKAKKQRARCRS